MLEKQPLFALSQMKEYQKETVMKSLLKEGPKEIPKKIGLLFYFVITYFFLKEHGDTGN